MKFSVIWAYCQQNAAFAFVALLMSPVLMGLYVVQLLAAMVAPIAHVFIQSEKQRYLQKARVEGRKPPQPAFRG